MTTAEAVSRLELLTVDPEQKEVIRFVIQRLESLTSVLHGMAITLGLEVEDDTPRIDGLLEATERLLNARRLSDYLRGVRAARALSGRDPDSIPEFQCG